MNPTEKLLAQLLETLKAGDASGTPTATWASGPGGVLNAPMRPGVVNAMLMPKLGLQARIPVKKSTYLYEQIGILTGITAGSGSNPTAVCDPWPRPGNLKMIRVTTPFGRDGFSTDTINLTDPRLGGRVNRADFRDFYLIGDPMNGTEGKVTPTPPAGGSGNPLQSELSALMLKFKIGYFRKRARKFYNGNPVNNVYNGLDLVYGEAPGLDLLINTGYRDANTGIAGDIVDSFVQNWNVDVAATKTINGKEVGLVEYLTAIYRRQSKRANDAGLAPVKFAFTGPEQLFYQLTAMWPCAYQTYRCQVAGTDQRVISIDGQLKMTEDMRQNQYLLIDGEQVEYIADDGVLETDTSGTFSTTLSLVPLTYAGSEPGIYTEYFDFNNPDSTEMRNAFKSGDEFVITDNGRFFWTKRKNGPCVSMDAVEMSRTILEVPFLAAKILNVKYTPIIQTVSGWTDAGSRFLNGGVTSTPVPSPYTANPYIGV